MATTKGKSPKLTRTLMAEMKKLLKPLPIEVIGHIESEAYCCRNGTVALVKIDQSRVMPAPLKKKTTR
jgi:siroheme synthase (precorrin-2 oxidase/ferrochelatase)